MQSWISKTRIIILMIAITSIASAQTGINFKSLNELIPNDPSVRMGRLANGMKYYIKANKKPENRAELRLAVDAGATLEDDDQNGLAHLCEHMAFNGTTNFPKNDLINFIESIGMRFGGDLNAYTDYEETVYMLQCPTDSMPVFDKAFQVFEDWAMNVTYDNKEIDKERGVVIEEYRLGKGAEDRVWKKHEKVLFLGSRYAERDIIGDTNVLRKCSYETLKRFYKTWYRPDLMAVIAVGDFDVDLVEKMIKEHFSKILITPTAKKRTRYELKDYPTPRVSIATDKELSAASVDLYFIRKDRPENTFGSYRQTILTDLYNSLLNDRMKEISKKPNPPFIRAYSSEFDWQGKRRAYNLSAEVDDAKLMTGFEALLTEAFRVERHGFTQTELDRQKADVLKNIEKQFNERDKTYSRVFAWQYVSNYLKQIAMPSIETKLELYKKFLPEITLDEVNNLAKEFIKKENSVILVSAPDRATPPSSDQVLARFDEVSKMDLPAYIDKVSDQPLFDKTLKPGKVVKENKYEDLGVTEWKLSNGITVVLKPTDFKNDEILMSAISPGGTSLATDEELISAKKADDIVDQSGIGSFSSTELEKKLSGKIVNVTPYIGTISEGFNGSTTPSDLETMFQLVNMYFTEPREDKDAYDAYMEKLKTELRNEKLSPESAYYDTINVTMSNYSNRRLPESEELLNQVDLQKAMDFYKSRFEDASDFIFCFVGNFDLATIKPLVLNYLSTLPSIKKKEKEIWADEGVRYPQGVISKEVKKGKESKSSVTMFFTGECEWSIENRFYLQAMMQVLNIKLREKIREDKSGTYGIGAYGGLSHYPIQTYSLQVGWGCSPNRAEELSKSVIDEIKELSNKAPDETYVNKVKETMKRSYETYLKDNRFWLSRISEPYFDNYDPNDMLKSKELIETITADQIKSTAAKYFNFNNFDKFIWYPENN